MIRTFLKCAPWALALTLAMGASAQTFPDRPVKIIVPYPAGGSTDAIARQLANTLSKQWKQPVVVDNRPGANSIIAAQFVTNSPADGYTWLMADPSSLSINPSLFQKLPYSPTDDFAPTSLIARAPAILLVNPASRLQTMQDLVREAKANPGKLTYGSPAAGTPVQVAMEIVKDVARIDMAHVPYKGGAPALQDLMAGQIDLVSTDVPTAMAYVKSARLRALVVTSDKRAPALPDVPTLADAGFAGRPLTFWFGVVVPKKTPNAVQATITKGIQDAVAGAELRTWLTAQSLEPTSSTPEEFARTVRDDADLFGQTVRRLGIKLD